MNELLIEFRNMVASLPTHSSSAVWVMSRKHYNMMVHANYKRVKATRKAKARRKRVRSKCGQ